ncbi:CHAT domain-containing protein [Dapis sp. BLCC M126]|uniref:CHAT domain-containing protein n=1 Tax=Dapis sp. BLCC M126 TaxID=3400189 RepID=UPI003CF40688
MKPIFVQSYSITAFTIILGALTATPANSQPITPANDGTNTTVTPQGNQFNIKGGTRSGANLFHSFDKFNLHTNQTANFLTTPDTSNIFGRVTGGKASYINGLIQVIGGNSNLFLMNPAGIMFGPNASLNIPASFSVTTATGIGFDNNNFWFKAMGTNDYSKLVGNPSGYKFDLSNPGAIVNEGNLSSGKNLTLLGGTIINTGELSTKNGNITIAAVEGGSTLRISQPGHLLSLEVESKIENISNLSPLSLSELLTGGKQKHATSIIVNNNGELELTDNTIIADTPGNVFISGKIDLSNQDSGSRGKLEIKSAVNVTLTENISADGAINIEATGDIVATGSGIKGGGESVSLSATNIRINDEFDETSGDADVKLEAKNNITVEDIEDDVLEFLPGGGEIEFRADVDGDGIGVVQMLDNEADVGSDPNRFENGADTIKTNGRNLTIAGAGIILGNIDTSWLPVYSGGGELIAAIDVDEGGPIPGEGATFTFTVDGELGNVENLDVRFSAQHTFNGDLAVALKSPQGQEVTLFAGVGGGGQNFQDTVLDDNASTSINSGGVPFNGAYIPQGSLTDFNGESPNGTWTLRVTDTRPVFNNGTLYRAGEDAPWGTATGTELLLRNPLIQVAGGRGNGNSGAIALEATHSDINVVNLRSFSETGNGGRVDLKANNNIMTGLINSSSIQGIGGDINLNAFSGNIDIYSLDTSSVDRDGGNVEIKAVGDITTASLFSYSRTLAGNSGNGGAISLEAGGDITTASLWSYSYLDAGNSENGGAISLVAGGDISTASLWSFSRSFGGNSGNGGAISLVAGGDISTALLNSFSIDESFAGSSTGNGGDISLVAGGDISTAWLWSYSQLITGNSGNGGAISLVAGGDISTASFLSYSFSGAGNSGNGGAISLEAGGNISTDLLHSMSLNESSEGNSGNGGAISLSVEGNISTENLDSSSSSFAGNSGNGGAISVEAQGDLSTTDIRSYSYSGGGNSGNGGAISVEVQSDLSTTDINSASASEAGNSGNGGAISLKADTIKFNPAIRTFSVGINDTSANGGEVNITTNNLSNTEILSLSSHGKSGEVIIESQPQGNLELNDSSIITSKQVTIQLPFGGEVQIDLGGTEGQSGPVSIISNGNLNLNNVTIESDTKGDQEAGNVHIYSQGNITLNNTDILSTTNAQGNAGNITLETEQDILLTNSSKLQASTETRENAGNAGTINIQANTLNLDQSTNLITETTGAGNSGDITIEANTVDIGEDSQITATVVIGSTSNGDGGNITINTDTLNISGKLGIFAETEATANAGTLTLSPYKNNSDLDINFGNDGFISASTSSIGNGGNIFISAPENINILGEGFIAVETTDIGNAGIIDIQTENLRISDGVAISASTEDKGNAGQININTTEFTLEKGTSLTTETNSKGKAGDIQITTQELTIGEDAQITATAKKGATNTEAGGNITINANELFISGRLGIFAETASKSPAGSLTIKPYRRDGGMGRGGEGEIGRWGDGNPPLTPPRRGNGDPVLNITFKEKGFISARTLSTGGGGNINILAPENINISGSGRITVETTGSGNGGIINIETENLTIGENTTISASTSDSGDGGSININPTQTFQLEGRILTETKGAGNGGSITINTGKMTAPNSTISAKSTDTGNAGTIDITTQENITTGIITSQAKNKTETADGGNISITSEQGEINATQPIQSFSEGANAGDVTLRAKTDIKTNTINSHGQQQGGEIIIRSETGNIDTSNSQFLANYSGRGDAGNVILTAPQGNITTNNIYSFADADGGQIIIKAGGDIKIRENSNIISASEPPEDQRSGTVGRGGDIILEAGNNINTTTARIYSGADDGHTGKIDIIADGAIETGQIDLASGFVRDRIIVNQNFTLIPLPQGEATQGVAGNITLNSNNSRIDTTAGTINSRSPEGTGNISLNAGENITTGKLEASALNPNEPTTGGDVRITSQQGEINVTQAIETFSKRGTAGNVNIKAEGSVNIENILSQGTQRGGDITIDSRSQNSINAEGALNTFSTEGIGGDVNLTSPGNIAISGIRSEGMEQGGDITVESEIGNIDSNNGNIDSFSTQGIAGNITLNASESVNLANVSSFGATESGDLIIQSRTAQVNTGNVTTQAPAGSSGSIFINGEEVGTGDLSSIGTTSAGEINVEATDGSITTYDIEISSDGTIGDLILRATEDITTEDIDITAGEGDANINIESGENQAIEDIDVNAENDATTNFTAGGNQDISDVNVNAGNDATTNFTAGGDQDIGDVNVNATNDATTNFTAGGDQDIGDVNVNATNDAATNFTAGGDQDIGDFNVNATNDATTNLIAGGSQNTNGINVNAGNESIIIQNPQMNLNIDSISGISNNNNNNNSIVNLLVNQNNPQDNTNTSNNFTNNATTNVETNSFSTTIISDIISTTTPSNNNQTTNTATAQEQTESSINNTTDTQEILNIIDTVNTNPLTVATGSEQMVMMLEENRIKEYSDYFGEDFNEELVNTKNVRDLLTDMANKTGKESAVIYINAELDQLQIILFTKSGQPIIKIISEANRKQLIKLVLQLRGKIINRASRHTDNYLQPAQQLYDWLIAPISAELEIANIDTLLFSMDEGLRTLPVGVLHDGEEFLIEKYSISLIPSVSLMDTNYRPLQDTQLLAMGASKFIEQDPLPAVPVELETISQKLWQGSQFLNQEFTRDNLVAQRQNYPYPIIHLSTHAEFLPGKASNSYIQLWGDEQIKLNQVRQLGWSQPAVELLVLSACRTAVGDRNAELGFAGLAVAAGVKSALASIWYVNDEGTLGLMTEFYTHLNNAKIKAEALRQAQLAMLRGEVIIEDGELKGSGTHTAVVLPSALGKFENKNLSHPYYWAGFTMVGSPW